MSKQPFVKTTFLLFFLSMDEYFFTSPRLKTKSSSEKWGSIFRKAKSLLHLTVTGGEPFIRKDFVEIIDNIIKNCGVPRISIKTNGFYIDRIKNFIPKLIEKHPGTEFTLSISLDGPEEVHDKVRNFKGAYNKVLETIDEMKRPARRSAPRHPPASHPTQPRALSPLKLPPPSYARPRGTIG